MWVLNEKRIIETMADKSEVKNDARKTWADEDPESDGEEAEIGQSTVPHKSLDPPK